MISQPLTPIPVRTALERWQVGFATCTRVAPVIIVHLLFLGGVWFVTVGWTDVAALIALSAVRGLGITLGYHRLLTHRSFRTSRLVQFVLAVLGASTFENGPLWWVGHHRYHHIHSDKPRDIHSPRRGFWWSHLGWVFDPQMNRPPEKHTRDLALYPELVWLDRFAHLPGALLAGLCFWLGGWTGLVFVFAGSSVLILHGTWCVNSLSHIVGSRRFNTPDDSRNNFWVAFFAMGEGWHNNHHACPVSSRHGLVWYELDSTYWVILLMEAVGLAWGVKRPPVLRRDKVEADHQSPLADELGHTTRTPAEPTNA